LREASELAADRIEDEPAAILFAMTRRPRRLGDAWQALPLVLAENMARKAGMQLRLDIRDVELESLRLRVAARLATFDDVRAWAVDVRLFVNLTGSPGLSDVRISACGTGAVACNRVVARR
jgi:hypothetical protein